MLRNLEYIKKDMGQMEAILSKRDVKYRRSFNRFYSNANRMEDIWTVYGQIQAYYSQVDEIGIQTPYINICRSAIDTTASKLSQTKVRPFFNPVLGTFETQKVCRNAQVYFDEYYDTQKVYKKSIDAITDALVFDMGVVWIDAETKSVIKIKPWEFFFDMSEMTNDCITKCSIKRKQYPLSALEHLIKKDSPLFEHLTNNPSFVVTYRIYFDLLNKKQYKFIEDEMVQESKLESSTPPFVWIYYKDPIKGAFSDSMLDVILPIQRIVDDLTYKIAAAAELSPANTIFIPRGSDIKTSMLASSKIGDVFEYNASATGGAVPISIATPPAIDGQYLQLLEMFEQKAYNLVGVSQLSAQSKKPSGLNSGVALQTLEDVESERFNVLLQNYINFTKDIAEKMIECFSATDEILPKRRGRSSSTWKDIKRERDMFNIQYSSSSSLSKDPVVKMQQIEKLIAMKVLDPSIASKFLEMPDLEGAYSITTASFDMNEKIIERVIEDGPAENGQFNFYEGTNIQGLFAQSLNTLMRLDSNDEKPEVLERLVAFVGQLKEMMDEINAELTPPPAPAPIQPPEVAGPTNNLPLA